MLGLQAKQLIILCMTTNPHPNKIFATFFNSQGSESKSNSGRSKLADLLEMKRRMAWLGFEQFETAISVEFHL
jgi:hypothetical protein